MANKFFSSSKNYSHAISCIVPCYNVAPYIKQCLDSILKQTFWIENQLQIILINDGSTDETTSILREYKQKYPKIILIEQKNHGLGYARNIGLKQAKGKYIAFIDSDDWLAVPESLNILFNVAEYTHEYIVFGNFLIDFPETPTKNWVANSNKTLIKVFLEAKHSHYMEMPMLMAKLYRHDFLLQHEIIFENTWAEDQLFHWRTLLKAHGMLVVPDIVYHYRQRLDSLSKNVGLDKMETLTKIRTKQFALFRAYPYAIDNELLNYLHASYMQEIIRYLYYFMPATKTLSSEQKNELLLRCHHIMHEFIGLHDIQTVVARYPNIKNIYEYYLNFEAKQDILK